MKYISLILIFTFCLISCTKKNTVDKNTVSSEKIEPKYQKLEFNITGMTCEIGCARLIESKLSKTDGVKFTKVSFVDSLAVVEFDANKLTVSKVTNIVNKIAGGDLYKTSNNKTVNKFTILK